MKYSFFFLLVALLSASCSSTTPRKDKQTAKARPAPGSAAPADSEVDFALPAGWKLPQKLRKSACRRGEDHLYEATADLDGDGEPDTARLLIREKGQGLGVWIWLANQSAPVLASISEVRDDKHDMGLKVVESGSYATACGKGHWPCGDKEPAELTLERQALDFFNCEGANRYLYWDNAQGRFVTTWMSD